MKWVHPWHLGINYKDDIGLLQMGIGAAFRSEQVVGREIQAEVRGGHPHRREFAQPDEGGHRFPVVFQGVGDAQGILALASNRAASRRAPISPAGMMAAPYRSADRNLTDVIFSMITSRGRVR
jgi:hypothetical protein